MMPLSFEDERLQVPSTTMVPQEPDLNLMALSPSLASVRSRMMIVTSWSSFFTEMEPFEQLPVNT